MAEISKIQPFGSSTQYDLRDTSKLPLTGGTMTGNIIPNTDLGYSLGNSDKKWNIYGKLTLGTYTSLTTGAMLGIELKSGNNGATLILPTTGNDNSNAAILYSTQNGNDVGCFYVSPDTAFVANSGDQGYVFRVIDKDIGSNPHDLNTNDSMMIGIKQSNGGMEVASALYPTTDNTRELGTSSLRWKNAYAVNFNGNLKGNADTATSSTKATQDSDGNTINTTYLKTIPYRTLRDFTKGTLITTSLDGGTTSSSLPFHLRIYGNGYGQGIVCCDCQGYVYLLGNGYSTYVNIDALSYGSTFPSKIYAFSNLDGKLCFWFARDGYWLGYDIICQNMSQDNSNFVRRPNYVTSVIDAELPDSDNRRWLTEIPVKQSLHSNNYNLYTVKKDGTGASGTWGISISGNAAIATKAGVASQYGYFENSNELNFGGTGNGDTIYIGYRAKDSKNIPSKFIFGSSTGTANLQVKTVYLGSGTSSYISSTNYTGNAATASRLNITSTDNAIARFDGTNGTIQNSGVTIDDNNNINTTGNIIISKQSSLGWDDSALPSFQMVGADNKVFKFKYSVSGTNIDIGWDYTNGDGPGAAFRSSNSSNNPGAFIFYARKNTSGVKNFIGLPDGTLTWDGRRVVTSTNSTAVGSSSLPVYIDANGYAQTITSYNGNASTATALTSDAGSSTQPIYFTGGKPTATSYSLSATINSGAANRLAYYNSANAISYNNNLITSTSITYGNRTLTPTLRINNTLYADSRIESGDYFLVNKANAGASYYLYSNDIEYGRFYVNTIGVAGTATTYTNPDDNSQTVTGYTGNVQGIAVLSIGNNKSSGSNGSKYSSPGTQGVANNARGYLRLYSDNTGYAELTSSQADQTRLYPLNGFNIPENKVGIMFRPGLSSYYTYTSYQTAGNEALVFGSKQNFTSFIFVNGEDPANAVNPDRWYKLTGNSGEGPAPGLQIKQNCVSIGSLISNGVNASYKLQVNGLTGILNNNSLQFEGANSSADTWIKFKDTTGLTTYLGIRRPITSYGPTYYDGTSYHTLLRDDNYINYTVKKDGTGASGTWGINITGTADWAKLLKPIATTTTASASTWNIPSGCKQVWGERFSDSTLTYTPSGGSATTITDTGDWTMWLAPNATSNVATLNMRIDGAYYANGGFNGNLTGNADTATKLSNTPNDTTKFLRGDNTWTNYLTDKIVLSTASTGATEITGDMDAIIISPKGQRSGTANSYYPGVAFNHMWTYSGSYKNSTQGWIGLRLHSTPGSELSYLVLATKPNTGTSGTGNDLPIERMCIAPDGKIGINTKAPTEQLEVNGSIKALSFIGNATKDNDGNQINTTYLKLSGGTMTGAVSPLGKEHFILYPSDGEYTNSSSSITGYFKIKIPKTKSATMFSFDFTIYNYIIDQSVVYHFAGYNYTDASWNATTGYCVSPLANTKANLPIRFISDGGDNMFICIGNTDTNWSYPKGYVHNITIGHSGNSYANWASGWTITLENTAFTASQVKRTIENSNICYTATKLATGRTFQIKDADSTNAGTASSTFDGSANLIINLPSTIKANVTGNCSGSSGSCTGNANTATTATNATNIYSSASTSKAYVLGTLTASSANHGTVYNASVYTQGTVLYGAAWNDYAEKRQVEADEMRPGMCVREIGDDTMQLTTERLQRGCKIISDTYGFCIGETNIAKTPIAVSGRVLAYIYEGREAAKHHIGYGVCSGPNGTVSIMTEEEERMYPMQCIGTISAVPDYETWGENNINVDGRVWIYVK